jgi:hypothetical protein
MGAVNAGCRLAAQMCAVSSPRIAGRFLLIAGIATLAGCTTVTQATAPPPSSSLAVTAAMPNIAITVADLQGSWGLASFRNEADRPRTETEAKAACNNPYKVDAGPNGGAMMYLADQTTPTEVVIKTTSAGQVFIGPPGPPGVAQDRVVLSYENNVLVTDWLDPSARERYGTMILVRCGVA